MSGTASHGRPSREYGHTSRGRASAGCDRTMTEYDVMPPGGSRTAAGKLRRCDNDTHNSHKPEDGLATLRNQWRYRQLQLQLPNATVYRDRTECLGWQHWQLRERRVAPCQADRTVRSAFAGGMAVGHPARRHQTAAPPSGHERRWGRRCTTGTRRRTPKGQPANDEWPADLERRTQGRAGGRAHRPGRRARPRGTRGPGRNSGNAFEAHERTRRPWGLDHPERAAQGAASGHSIPHDGPAPPATTGCGSSGLGGEKPDDPHPAVTLPPDTRMPYAFTPGGYVPPTWRTAPEPIAECCNRSRQRPTRRNSNAGSPALAP